MGDYQLEQHTRGMNGTIREGNARVEKSYRSHVPKQVEVLKIICDITLEKKFRAAMKNIGTPRLEEDFKAPRLLRYHCDRVEEIWKQNKDPGLTCTAILE